MLELIGTDKTFNRGTVNEIKLFENFSLSVKTGEFVSVVGSNGSGKTTLIKKLLKEALDGSKTVLIENEFGEIGIDGGSIPVDSGKVILDGVDMTKLPEYKRAKKIGRVFQDPAVGTVPYMTITENLFLAANKGKPYNLSFAVDRKKKEYFREILHTLGLGLEDKTEIPVGLLSGGQRQALSLIMSTLTPVDLLLLDEHTAALDPKTAETIILLTDKIVREKKLTAIMITHNLRYAVEYGNRLIMMHEGKAIIDKAENEKAQTETADILRVFNEISIECGN